MFFQGKVGMEIHSPHKHSGLSIDLKVRLGFFTVRHWNMRNSLTTVRYSATRWQQMIVVEARVWRLKGYLIQYTKIYKYTSLLENCSINTYNQEMNCRETQHVHTWGESIFEKLTCYKLLICYHGYRQQSAGLLFILKREYQIQLLNGRMLNYMLKFKLFCWFLQEKLDNNRERGRWWWGTYGVKQNALIHVVLHPRGHRVWGGGDSGSRRP